MNWLKTYHDDHDSVLVLLAKLEGNIKDLQSGQDTPNIFTEFVEFGDVIKDVWIPHFKREETGVYQTIANSGPEGEKFIDFMLREHQALYKLFDQYFAAVESRDKGKLIEISNTLEKVLRHHVHQEEERVPQFLESIK